MLSFTVSGILDAHKKLPYGARIIYAPIFYFLAAMCWLFRGLAVVLSVKCGQELFRWANGDAQKRMTQDDMQADRIHDDNDKDAIEGQDQHLASLAGFPWS